MISLTLAVTIAGFCGLVTVPAHAVGNGSVYLIQGLPGQTIDVAVDGKTVASGVKAAPVITTYANNLTAVPKDKASLRVAHTAAVGPADIKVNGKVLFSNVANGESLSVVVPAATYEVEIVPAGANSPVILGPLPLPVKAGDLTRVYAIGEPASKTMNVAVATLKLPATGSDKPGMVNTGTGGQAVGLMNQDPRSPWPLAALVIAAGLLLTITVRKAVRR